ncbi:predicted protein [Botrytis cinerea T4]|uniref:Uncharacterized protein n=1 Tax=Botryotinia fuckeliana (strain T4) TaxID=999810 RepID=G2YAZ4_BOTF4|nr:predicted protein [Botrytis cinerea T4]
MVIAISQHFDTFNRQGVGSACRVFAHKSLLSDSDFYLEGLEVECNQEIAPS